MRHGNALVDQPDDKRIKVDLRGEQTVTCGICGHEFETSKYELYDADNDWFYVYAKCPECGYKRGTIELYQRPDQREHEGAKGE
jgi:DNA-directed RNA polymerase subunit RPC12/RpoP